MRLIIDEPAKEILEVLKEFLNRNDIVWKEIPVSGNDSPLNEPWYPFINMGDCPRLSTCKNCSRSDCSVVDKAKERMKKDMKELKICPTCGAIVIEKDGKYFCYRCCSPVKPEEVEE